MKGRKPEQESRAAEFRQRLMAWKLTPESSRPSLRALARELGTSHQLLAYFLNGLEKWQYMERSREAERESDQILARAYLEERPMTEWEKQRVHDCTMASLRAQAACEFLDSIERIRQDAKHGPLHPAQIKMLTLFVRIGFPGAQELLQKCLEVGVKQRKRFAEILEETPRQDGETFIAWVRRIWDQCSKYDTKCPRVITEKLLQKCSQSSVKDQKNNLPALSADVAKSFKVA